VISMGRLCLPEIFSAEEYLLPKSPPAYTKLSKLLKVLSKQDYQSLFMCRRRLVTSWFLMQTIIPINPIPKANGRTEIQVP